MHRDQQGPQDLWDPPDSKDLLVPVEQKADLVLQGLREAEVLLVPEGLLVYPDHLDLVVMMVKMVTLVRLDFLDLQGLLDLKDCLDLLDSKDPLVIVVLMVEMVLLVMLVLRDPLEIPVQLAQWVFLDLQESGESADQPEHEELLATMEVQDKEEHQV